MVRFYKKDAASSTLAAARHSLDGHDVVVRPVLPRDEYLAQRMERLAWAAAPRPGFLVFSSFTSTLNDDWPDTFHVSPDDWRMQ